MADESLSSNPAARLVQLIDVAMASVREPQSEPVKQVWDRALGTENDDAKFLDRYAFVMRLPSRIRVQVGKLQNVNQALLLENLGHVESAFQVPLSAPWNEFIGHLNNTVMFNLRVISDSLDRSGLEPLITHDDLAQLVLELDQLRVQIDVAEDIDATLRTFLMSQVNRMRQVIKDYHLLGAEALRNSAEQTIGAIVVQNYVHPPQSPEGKSLLEKLGLVAATGLALCNIVAMPFNILAAQKQLEPGETQPSVVLEVHEFPESKVAEVLDLPSEEVIPEANEAIDPSASPTRNSPDNGDP
jgi:uncharacterized protein (UPF0262 family)